MPKRTHEEVEAESVKPKKARRMLRVWLTAMDGVVESSGVYIGISDFPALAKSTKQETACDLLRVMVEQAIANATRSEEEQEPTILLSSEDMCTTEAAPAPGPADIGPGAGMRRAVQRARSQNGQARPQYRPRAGRAGRCRVRAGGGCLQAGLAALQFLQVSVGDRKSIINWYDL